MIAIYRFERVTVNNRGEISY